MKQFIPADPCFSHEIEIKHSRFITHIGHTPDPKSAQQFIESIRQQHPKANHNCWAQIAGSRSLLNCRGSHDDGEPKGTAGKPMLNVIEHSEMCEICVVVTRYFGGIKLGAGGLVRAYSLAVQEALQTLPIIEKIEQFDFTLELPHHLVGEIEHFLNLSKVNITERNWSERLLIKGTGSESSLTQLNQLLEAVKHVTHYKDKFNRW